MARAKGPKPKWQLNDTVRRGRVALHLAISYRSAVEPRLSASRIDGLTADLGQLSGFPAERGTTLTGQKAATGHERDAAAAAALFVSEVREMAKRTQDIKAGELKSFGVGQPMKAASTSQVVGALNSIINTTIKQPELARKVGLVDNDLAEARAHAASLHGADAAQADEITTKHDKTFDKNIVQLRVEAAVGEISSRGARAMSANPVARGRFEALVSHAGPAAEDVTAAEAAAPKQPDALKPPDPAPKG